ncbi:MAG TPA: aminotransferase class III-fold pyridoxal phosphate-dependent enzyme [Acidimicrobiales bacterium]
MAVSRFLHPYAKPTRTDFVTIVRGEGARVYDAAGKEYVDAMASLWYMNVGYGRHRIVDAIAEQMRRLPAYNAFDPFTNEPAEHLADRLAGIAPVDDPRIFLTCDGSEAVDSAIKLARIAHVQAGQPERTIIVSRGLAYHGVTYGGLTAQGLPANQAGFGPLVPDFVNLPPNDLEAVATLFAEQGDRIAAVITEPIQGAGGVHPPVEGYLPGLRRLCDQHGAFLVMDEVICGFGRLGHWFGTERFGVRPDLITFAKGVSSGYIPVGGVVVGAKVRAPLEADPAFVLRHGHTYSGHAAAAAGALAALDITADEGLLDRAKPVGDRLADGLRSLAADGVVEQVRGDGAVWAVGLAPGQDPTAIRDRMLGLGVITRAIGTDTLSFCPPLVITDDEIDRVVDGLATALQ